jgi:hypothetical protein
LFGSFQRSYEKTKSQVPIRIFEGAEVNAGVARVCLKIISTNAGHGLGSASKDAGIIVQSLSNRGIDIGVGIEA